MLRTAFGRTIAAALADPAVIEVMVNPDGRLWIESATPDQLEAARRDIAAVLQQPLKSQVRVRLTAIDAVLSGLPIEEAAATARVLPDAVRRWLRVVSREGIDAAVDGWRIDRRLRPGRLDVDPATLHELAAKEKNPRIRKQMLALARVAEGMSPLDAAVSVGLQHGTVLRRMKRFREEGIAAFQDPKSAGRPHKLTLTELEEVGKVVLAHPELSYGDLRDLIRTRFRVGYSRSRLRHLLKVKLGIQWQPARSDSGVFRPEPSRKPAQGVKSAARQDAGAHNEHRRGPPRKLSTGQLEELREYVLKRPEASFWRLHRLVWNRFHVRHSHASLKRLLKSEFGIAWTGASKKLGEGLNLAELQDALADTTDWRMKKRLKALIGLAKGRDADTVARSHRVHLETLRKWTRPYSRSSIEGLRGGASTTS